MSKSTKLVLLLCAAVVIAPLASAINPPEQGIQFKNGAAAHRDEALDVMPSLTRVTGADVPNRPGLRNFVENHGANWEFFVDERSNRPNLVQGEGIAWVPGNGNTLGSLKAGGPVTLDVVRGKALGFLRDNSDLFDVGEGDLVFREEGSGNFGSHGQLFFVEFQQTYEGIPVEGATVFFRVNNGNLIAFGSERAAAIRGLSTRANLDEPEAFTKALNELGASMDDVREVLVTGDLKILPTMLPGERAGQAYAGAPGRGYRHVLAREFEFRLNDDEATYHAFVDARNGSVLQLLDKNVFATVTGGVQMEDGSQQVVTFPSNVATTAGPCTALDGVNFRMSDNCGAISVCDSNDANTGNGQVDMGTSGNDCATPAFGSAGNTLASRSGMYHLSRIRNTADTFHPTNSWLDGKVTSNMNINNTCNAYWSGSTLNFYRSGGGCGNTGQIPAVFLHEWGHGFDTNTGGAASDRASGEAVGDIFAAIYLQNSCIGNGFYQSGTCYNCTTCSGVRDLNDFSRQGTKPLASTANVANNSGINCDRYACPYAGYAGIMGYEGHCEAIIEGSAVWDLATHPTDGVGWSTTEQIWYDSLVPSKSAFRIVSGGQCNPSATTDGCGSSNWYTVFLNVDDDDGNLTNGTPNACKIWDNFNPYGIACGARPACSTPCTPPSAPTGLTATANGQTQIDLSWNLVSGATYNVYRGDGACGGGQSLIASGVSGTSYSDTSVSPGTQYNYAVAAVVSSCSSALSNCDSATTDSPPPGSCPAGYNTYNATVSAGGGDYTTATCTSGGGTFDGTVTCTDPHPADGIDFYLDKWTSSWWSSGWSVVAQDGSANCDEAITYSGTSGDYRWRVSPFEGTTSFTLCTNQC